MRSPKLSAILVAVFAAIITLSFAPIAQAQTDTVLYDFVQGWTGDYPDGTVVLDSAGNIYGSTQWGGECCGVVYEFSPQAGGGWTYKVLHGFSNSSYGAYVSPTLVQDSAGNLYGTTINGGNLSDTCNGPGCGVVFELSPTASGEWTETVLHTFSGAADGGNPYGQLLIGPDGSLYGTTIRGGNDHACTNKYVQGCGVVFRLKKSTDGWTESTLYTFTKAIGDSPNAGLVMDAAGNLYGTTAAYGGTLFELSPTASGEWTETTLINFNDTTQGYPESGLTMDSSGNIYGTTINPSGDCPLSGPCGTVFELSPAAGGGWTETILHTFMAGKTDGAYPISTSLDSAGNVYGVAFYGGDVTDCPFQGCGVVFELSPSSGGTWTETLLHEFTSGSDGNPNGLSGVVVDAAGNIFGTAAAGGANNDLCNGGCGVIFEITR